MELILLVIIGLLLISNAIFVYLYAKKKNKRGLSDYSDLALLSDLVNNHQAMIKITRVDPGNIFLRSPKDVQ